MGVEHVGGGRPSTKSGEAPMAIGALQGPGDRGGDGRASLLGTGEPGVDAPLRTGEPGEEHTDAPLRTGEPGTGDEHPLTLPGDCQDGEGLSEGIKPLLGSLGGKVVDPACRCLSSTAELSSRLQPVL